MITEAPQLIVDQIIDRMICDTPPTALLRWILQLDRCNLEFRRIEGICPCGEVDMSAMHGRLLA